MIEILDTKQHQGAKVELIKIFIKWLVNILNFSIMPNTQIQKCYKGLVGFINHNLGTKLKKLFNPPEIINCRSHDLIENKNKDEIFDCITLLYTNVKKNIVQKYENQIGKIYKMFNKYIYTYIN